MTLLELQKRINEMVAENEKRGWSDRNDMEVCIEMRRDTKRCLSTVFKLDYAIGGQHTVGDCNFGGTLKCNQKRPISPRGA